MAVEKATLKKRIPVPFFLTLTAFPAAGSYAGLSSDMITFPYKIVKVQAHFRDDANNALQVWAFVSTNRNVGTAPPPDNKILGFYSPTPYLIGNGEIVNVDCDVYPAENEKYLKVYFCNNNAYAMTGYCIITIETLEGVSPEAGVVVVGGADERKYSAAEWLAIGQEKAKAMVLLNVDLMTGTSEKYADQIATGKAQNLTTGNGLIDRYLAASYFPSSIPAGVPVQDIPKFLEPWTRNIRNLTFEVHNAQFYAGMPVGALGGSSMDFEKYLEDTFGLLSSVKKLVTIGVEKALVPPVEQYWNTLYHPQIPGVADLINMVVKETIQLRTFKDFMLKQGYDETWSQLIWDAHFIVPSYGDMQRAYWRGTIKEEELDYYLKLFDLDPRYNDVIWKPLLEQIPPYSELVNERVKEVTTQAEFDEGLSYWGFKGKWGKRIWDAHFMPATFMDFLTAMRRKLPVTIPRAGVEPVSYTFGADAAKDIETVKELSVLADYDPRYWDFFKTRIYNDPTPRLARWAFETGDMPESRVGDIVHRFGYYTEDEKWITDMFIHFQERPWVEKYLTALQTAYIQEAISAEELEKRVIVIPRNKSIADWMVKIADVRKEILAKSPTAEKLKLLTDSDLRKAYYWDKIDAEKLRSELLLRGYSLADIDILIEVVNEEKQATIEGGMKKGLTISELFDAFRYNFKTEEQVRTELMLRGMTLEDAQTLIDTRKAKWAMGGQTGGD